MFDLHKIKEMKRIWMACLALMTMGSIYGQKQVSSDSLRYYDGKVIQVCERINDTFVTLGAKKTTFLNFGYGYPNQLFTVVIFEDALKNFPYVPAEYLKGKKVCIIGDVRMYSGMPEIIVEGPDQVRVE